MLDIDKKTTFKYDLIARYNTEMKKIDSKLNVLLELRAGKEITPEEYLSKKNKYIDARRSYYGKISDLRGHYDEKFERLENFAEIILQAQDIMESDDAVKKRQLLQSISLNLSISEGNLQIEFKKPFSFYFKEEKQLTPSTVSGREDLNLRPHAPKARALAN